MKTWIDFIGEKHYSKQGFIDESEQYGVTRRIPRHQLKRFRFGDRVMAAIREGKRPILFGYYVIERISGLSSTALKALSEKFSTKMIAEGGRVVHRGCGSYVEGATLTIEASLEEIAEVLKDVKDYGKLMIGGTLHEHEEVRLKSIKSGPETRSIRPFNYESFLVAVHEAKQTWDGKGCPSVKGYFYVSDVDDEGFEGPLAEIEAEVQEVYAYERIEGKDAGEKQKNLKSGRTKNYRSKAKRDREKAKKEQLELAMGNN